MAYAIMRLSKIKSNAKGKAAAHNHRSSDEIQPNINGSLSHLNVYAKKQGTVVERINALLPDKRRKDAVEAVEVVLTASPEFFNGMGSTPGEIAKNPRFQRWANDSVKFVQDTFGKANVVDVSVHLDEATPHIHVLFVPLTNDGRLCFKDLSGKQNLRKYQDTYAAAMKPHGLQRGECVEVTDRVHTSLKEGRKALQRAAAAKLLPLPVMPKPNMLGVCTAAAVEKLHKVAQAAVRKANDLLSEREMLKDRERHQLVAERELVERKNAVFAAEVAVKEAVKTLSTALHCTPEQVPSAIERIVSKAASAAPAAAVELPERLRLAEQYQEPRSLDDLPML